MEFQISRTVLNGSESKLDKSSYPSLHHQTAPVSSFGGLEIAAFTVIPLLFFVSLLIFVYFLGRIKSKSRDETDEFFNGCDLATQMGRTAAGASGLNGPYKKNCHELSKKSFTVDEASSLGSGAFGKICRGRITNPTGGECVEVAVKMTKVPCPRTGFKGLLFEIKILSFLGAHPNVVELKGAYTAELKKGKVLVFLELCELGSLEGYLRTCKSSLLERQSSTGAEGINDEYEVKGVADLDESLVKDMSRWSREIACGMEYIASKHIVHLDLASRNILLTIEKRAKISDFGLSRRMYDYQPYKKKTREPVPWRWMAPESLQTSEFTEKSDVWGYGILLWEIYSLGDEPYPGFSWDPNFPLKLENGLLRLSEPRYNCNNMYSVMLRCWATSPHRRPTFSELLQILDKSSVEGGERLTTVPVVEIDKATTSGQASNDMSNDVEHKYKPSSSYHPVTFPKFHTGRGCTWLSLAITLLLLITIIGILIFNKTKNTSSILPHADFADETEFPHHVALAMDGQCFCSGVILTQNLILTTGHCVKYKDKALLTVVAGSVNLKLSSSGASSSQVRRIRGMFLYRNYEWRSYVNDLAIIQLDQPLRYTSHVRNISLPRKNERFEDSMTVSVWGRSAHGEIFNRLRKIVVPIVPNEICGKEYSAYASISDSQFCAGSAGIDLCPGSVAVGSPAICRSRDTADWKLCGMASFGRHCGISEYPDVYTKLTSYVDWIESKEKILRAIMEGGCYDNQFPCANRRCVSSMKVCDHYNDCRDGSDEVGCSYGLQWDEI